MSLFNARVTFSRRTSNLQKPNQIIYYFTLSATNILGSQPYTIFTVETTMPIKIDRHLEKFQIEFFWCGIPGM